MSLTVKGSMAEVKQVWLERKAHVSQLFIIKIHVCKIWRLATWDWCSISAIRD